MNNKELKKIKYTNYVKLVGMIEGVFLFNKVENNERFYSMLVSTYGNDKMGKSHKSFHDCKFFDHVCKILERDKSQVVSHYLNNKCVKNKMYISIKGHIQYTKLKMMNFSPFSKANINVHSYKIL